jgi:hypothetical protein
LTQKNDSQRSAATLHFMLQLASGRHRNLKRFFGPRRDRLGHVRMFKDDDLLDQCPLLDLGEVISSEQDRRREFGVAKLARQPQAAADFDRGRKRGGRKSCNIRQCHAIGIAGTHTDDTRRFQCHARRLAAVDRDFHSLGTGEPEIEQRRLRRRNCRQMLCENRSGHDRRHGHTGQYPQDD